MAQLELLKCSGCSSTLPPNSLECEYCGNKNLIRSKSNKLKITQTVAQEYIKFYQQKTKDNPKDTNALYSMGLLYLNLKNYELAQRNFKEAIDQSPMEADMYYYYALSLVAGKDIGSMSGKEIERAESYLKTALGIETKCKYLVLLASIKEEYYVMNHMIIRDETPKELLNTAKDYSPDELDEITENCKFRGKNTQKNINKLLNRQYKGADNEAEHHNTAHYHNVGHDLTEEQRLAYFDHYDEPTAPSWNAHSPDLRYLSKRNYYEKPVLARLWKLPVMIILSLIIFAVATCARTVEDYYIAHEIPTVQSVADERIAQREQELNRRLNRQEREEIFQSAGIDSVRAARRDARMYEEYFPLISAKDDVDEGKHIIFVRKGIWGIVTLLLIFAPILFWLFGTIKIVTEIHRQRKYATRRNANLDLIYKENMELHYARPTDAEMQGFITEFLSKLADRDLEYHHKDPETMKGKILFVNYRGGMDDPYIKFSLVLCEEDCVTLIESTWCIYENDSREGKTRSISYSDISEIELAGDRLSIGDRMSVYIPYNQEFYFQDKNPNDKQTYSTIYTSSAKEFAVALRKLHIAFKSKK